MLQVCTPFDLLEKAEVNAGQSRDMKKHTDQQERETVFPSAAWVTVNVLQAYGILKYPTPVVSQAWRRPLLWFLDKSYSGACRTRFQGGHAIDFLKLCTEGLCSNIFS